MTELRLPLAVDTDARAGMAWNNHIVDAAGNRICFMAHDGTEENLLGEAWVALIIKAVNNHQALIDALTVLAKEADSFCVSDVCFSDKYMGHKGLDMAFDALEAVQS